MRVREIRHDLIIPIGSQLQIKWLVLVQILENPNLGIFQNGNLNQLLRKVKRKRNKDLIHRSKMNKINI